jgi:hypothetical protein
MTLLPTGSAFLPASLSKWLPRALCAVVKRPGRAAYPPSSYTAGVKNAWSCTVTPTGLPFETTISAKGQRYTYVISMCRTAGNQHGTEVRPEYAYTQRVNIPTASHMLKYGLCKSDRYDVTSDLTFLRNCFSSFTALNSKNVSRLRNC